MRTDSVRRVLGNGGLALLLGAGMMAASLSAQQSPTTEQCQGRINSFITSHSLLIDPPTRALAVQDCVTGNMERARALLNRRHAERLAQAEKQCLQTLDTFVQKAELRPSAGTLARARRRCAAGDLEGAIAAVKVNPGTPPSRPQAPPASEQTAALRRCLLELDAFIQRTGSRPDAATHKRAAAQCHAGGDSNGAIDIIRSAPQLPPPPPATLTPVQCLRNLDVFVARSGLTPDVETYAAARAHCESGDIRRATATIRGGTNPQ